MILLALTSMQMLQTVISQRGGEKMFTYVTTHILNSEASSVSDLPIYQAPYPLSYQAVAQAPYPSTGKAGSPYSAVFPQVPAPEFGVDYSNPAAAAGHFIFHLFSKMYNFSLSILCCICGTCLSDAKSKSKINFKPTYPRVWS